MTRYDIKSAINLLSLVKYYADWNKTFLIDYLTIRSIYLNKIVNRRWTKSC